MVLELPRSESEFQFPGKAVQKFDLSGAFQTMYDLSGKSALVTGCGKEAGIGRAIALRLASEGANVAIADICADKGEKDKNWHGLCSLATEIEGLDRTAISIACDITDKKQADAAIDAAAAKFGALDILVNNAGAAGAINLACFVSPDEWRKMMEINLTGTFLVSAAAGRYMMKRGKGGCIINIASWRGRNPAPFMAAYCASKAGVISLTEVMALELASHKIRVNAVCPGKVETDMERWGWQLKADASGKTTDDIRKEEEQKIPLGRIAQPADVANIVAFLASDQSNYMTGQIINFTGGMTLINTR
jgi:NAD(P)-dependent dehydrogenase (short-subunit alcohol dehydrogenase family)